MSETRILITLAGGRRRGCAHTGRDVRRSVGENCREKASGAPGRNANAGPGRARRNVRHRLRTVMRKGEVMRAASLCTIEAVR